MGACRPREASVLRTNSLQVSSDSPRPHRAPLIIFTINNPALGRRVKFLITFALLPIVDNDENRSRLQHSVSLTSKQPHWTLNTDAVLPCTEDDVKEQFWGNHRCQVSYNQANITQATRPRTITTDESDLTTKERKTRQTHPGFVIYLTPPISLQSTPSDNAYRCMDDSNPATWGLDNKTDEKACSHQTLHLWSCRANLVRRSFFFLEVLGVAFDAAGHLFHDYQILV